MTVSIRPDSPADEPELPPEVRAKLGEALDAVAEVLADQEFNIIGNAGAQKGFFFSLQAKDKKEFRKSRPCVFPGCVHTSIPASHTLQRNGPLVAIAEDNHVLTPEVRLSNRKLEMVSVGVGEASTFPGFCPEHEKLFSDLERRRELSRDRDLALQIFRVVCREIVVNRYQIERFKSTLRAWRKVISDRGIAMVREKIGHLVRVYPVSEMKSLVVQGISKYEHGLSETLRDLTDLGELLEKEFQTAALADIEGRNPGMAHFVAQVEQSIPVCLAGLGTIHVHGKLGPTKAAAILNVWPTVDGTTISLAVLER